MGTPAPGRVPEPPGVREGPAKCADAAHLKQPAPGPAARPAVHCKSAGIHAPVPLLPGTWGPLPFSFIASFGSVASRHQGSGLLRRRLGHAVAGPVLPAGTLTEERQ